ncbi:MAG TPA: hypothetical protein VGR56_05450 [Nitrososphaerales archaeon]|nr:hypothetical protein [Nitrososphaerales archaeon]
MGAAVSMADPSWLFLYTPIPYLAAMYLAAYRNDLGRISRPIRDRAGRREWWLVCRYLDMIGADVRKLGRSPWKSPLFVTALAASLVSLSWFVIPVHLSWYHFCFLQTLAALPLLLLLGRITGPVPYRPYRDVLPFPRLGTRVKHLKESKNRTGAWP